MGSGQGAGPTDGLARDRSVYIGKHRDNRENRCARSHPPHRLAALADGLGIGSVIASLSLGAPRTFILTHTNPPPAPSPSPTTAVSSAPSVPSASASPNDDPATAAPAAAPSPLLYAHRTTLASGSLLVMQGATQQHWKHEVPREKRAVKTSRVSLTFRQLVF